MQNLIPRSFRPYAKDKAVKFLRWATASKSELIATFGFFIIRRAPLDAERREELRRLTLKSNNSAKLNLAGISAVPSLLKRIGIKSLHWAVNFHDQMLNSQYKVLRTAFRHPTLRALTRKLQSFPFKISPPQSAIIHSSFFKLPMQNARSFAKDSLEKMADQNGPVTIVLDRGINLPAFKDEMFKERDVRVYQFATSAELQKNKSFEQANSLQQLSLHDILPDISDESKAIYKQAFADAETILREVGNHISLVQQRVEEDRDIFILPFADAIASEQHVKTRISRAINSAEQGPIIFVSQTAARVSSILKLAEKSGVTDRIFVANPGHGSSRDADFWKSLCEAESEIHLSEKPLGSLSSFFTFSMQSISTTATQGSKLLRKSRCDHILAFSPAGKGYSTTAAAILSEIQSRGWSASVFSTNPTTRTGHAEVDAVNGGVNTSIGFLKGLSKSTFDDECRQALKMIVEEAAGTQSNSQIQIDTLHTICENFFTRNFQMIQAIRSTAEQVALAAPPKCVIALPSRVWQVRAFVSAFEKHGIPVIDVQAINLIEHPKYVKPRGSHMTVIDDVADRLYQNFLGVEPQRITRTGTPDNDAFLREFRKVDRSKHIKKHGLSANQKRILLVSQLQPMHRMAQLTNSILDFLENNPNVGLLIKLHPREGDDRRLEYEKLIGRSAAKDRVHFAKQMTPAEVIAISDVCVTIYSNMAREASTAGLPVIVTRLDGWVPPLRYDEEGLAQLADSNQALNQHLTTALDQERDGNSYLERNAHLLDARSATAIVDVAEKAIHKAPEICAHKPKNRPIDDNVVVVAESGMDALFGANLLPNAANIFLLESDDTYSSTKGQTVHKLGADLSSEWIDKANDAIITLSAHIETSLAGSTLQAKYRELSSAFKLQLRDKIISAVCKNALMEKSLSLPANQRVFVGRSLSFLEKAHAIAAEHGGSVSVIDLEDPSGQRSSQLQPKTLHSANTNDNLKETVASLDPWLEELSSWQFPLAANSNDHRPTLVCSAMWKLKTVPGTLIPVLKHFHASHKIVGFNPVSGASEAMQEDLSAHEIQSLCLSPAQLDKEFKTPARRIKQVLRELDFKVFEEQPPMVREALAKQMQSFFKVLFWRGLKWDALSRQLLSKPSSIALACPGRNWPSQIMNDHQETSASPSMTLQNSYMTGGYTYTAPNGKIVTAIDHLQAQLFQSSYGVAAERIVVTGCPRFDYLPQLKTVDTDSEFDILFIHQVGIDPLTRDAVRALCTADQHSIVIRMHPRASQEEREEITATISGFPHVQLTDASTDIAKDLSSARLVATAFSNVGIEAATLGMPVIAMAMKQILTVDLAEMGLAVRVDDEKQFRETAQALLSGGSELKELKRRQDEYFTLNPAFREGSSSQRICELLAPDTLGKEKKS